MRAGLAGTWVVVAAGVFAMLLAGCSEAPPPSPSATPTAHALNRHAAARQLSVGDCFDADDLSATGKQAGVRSCSRAHEDEVYARISLGSAATRPDDDHLQASASKQCLDRFPSYVGRDFNGSTLGYSYLYPSVDAWPAGDHEAICYLVNHGKHPLTRSMRDSRA